MLIDAVWIKLSAAFPALYKLIRTIFFDLSPILTVYFLYALLLVSCILLGMNLLISRHLN